MTERLVVGVGLRPSATPEALRKAVETGLRIARVRAGDDAVVTTLATLDVRVEHDAVVEVVALLQVDVRGFAPELLAAQPVSQRSPQAEEALGTPAVAEAAVLALGGDVVVPKTVGDGVTVAVGRLPDLHHHGDVEARAAANLVDLAVNVRPGGPPEWLRDRIVTSLADLGTYPDPAHAVAAVAERHGRRLDEVLLTAGGAEAFTLVARALDPALAAVVHPQFTEPEAALRAANRPVTRVPLTPPYTFDPALVPESADLVMIGNPTNPTSVLHPRDAIAELARPGRVLVVDEAFMDAVPGEPETLTGERLPGLVVVRSLTKTWALAGLRVGYVVGDPAVLAKLAAAQPMWSVSGPALAAAAATAGERAVAEAQRRAVDLEAQREYLIERLARIDGLAVVPGSRAPFVLLRGPIGTGPHALYDGLRARGWLARRGDTFPGLGHGWVRVAVRDRDTTDRFTHDLATLLHPPADTPERP
ncbi:Rv2231c family pyridoxal phosphate-dependent protein CobC [Spongisporangium articulatum]|uniref:Aminotransferase n=1 Tax=Spongisporangium articulatum TaxID=3362603 RepID=A0ABW8ALG2_9ACTN